MSSAIWSSLHTLDVVKPFLGKDYVESGTDYNISPHFGMRDSDPKLEVVMKRGRSLADSIAKLAVGSPSARDVSACAIELNFNKKKAGAVVRIAQNGGLSDSRLRNMNRILKSLKDAITGLGTEILSDKDGRGTAFSPLFNLGRWAILSYVRQRYPPSCRKHAPGGYNRLRPKD